MSLTYGVLPDFESFERAFDAELGGRVETATLPAFLASALINGDTSGLEDPDMKHYEAALQYAEPGSYVSVGEETFFSYSCDLPSWGRMGAEMVEYTILYPAKDWTYHLRGSDAETAARYGIAPEGEVNARKLYDYLQGLVNGWEEDGDDEAAGLASSILSTLGIEWI